MITPTGLQALDMFRSVNWGRVEQELSHVSFIQREDLYKNKELYTV